MALTEEEIYNIETYLKSESGPKWMTAIKMVRLKDSLHITETDYDEIDDSLNEYVVNTNAQFIRKSRLPSRYGNLRALWGHTDKVKKGEISSIFRQDNPIVDYKQERFTNSDQNPNLFISHSFKDTDAVIQLAMELDTHTIYPWLAEMDIPQGGRINGIVTNAIYTCDFFGVYLSPHSIASTWTAKEIEFAMSSGQKIIGFIDTSEQAINELKIALNQHKPEVREQVFQEFFDPNTGVIFLGTKPRESTEVIINSLKIVVNNWNTLEELIKNHSS